MAAKSVYAFVSLFFAVQQIHCENAITQCGLTSIEDSDQIIGPAHDPDKNPVGTWPWMASLGLYEDGKWEHKCGTTLISNKHFITAAHCVKTLNSRWKIKAGTIELNPKKPPRQRLDFEIKKVTVHPSFDDTAYYDIAVLTTQVIQLNKKIRPVCLPNEPSVESNKYNGQLVTIIGWGSSSLTTEGSDLLKRVDNQIYPKSHCDSVYRSQTQDTVPKLFLNQVICAGNNFGRQGSCKGDSGGPLMFLDKESYPNKFVQIGMVQGSIGNCGDKNIPSIFVRLDDPDIYHFLKCSQSDTCELNSRSSLYQVIGKDVRRYFTDCGESDLDDDEKGDCSKYCAGKPKPSLVQVPSKGTIIILEQQCGISRSHVKQNYYEGSASNTYECNYRNSVNNYEQREEDSRLQLTFDQSYFEGSVGHTFESGLPKTVIEACNLKKTGCHGGDEDRSTINLYDLPYCDDYLKTENCVIRRNVTKVYQLYKSGTTAISYEAPGCSFNCPFSEENYVEYVDGSEVEEFLCI